MKNDRVVSALCRKLVLLLKVKAGAGVAGDVEILNAVESLQSFHEDCVREVKREWCVGVYA